MKIEINEAYEKNLKHIDVAIERNSFTVVTGLSGSGKTSLLKDTLFVEAQRQYLEAMNMQGIAKPKVKTIKNLSPAILIDQEDHNDNPRSTLGTQTDIYTSLRMIFEKLHARKCPNCQKKFSAYEAREETEKINDAFNVYAYCPHCQFKMAKLTRTSFSFNTQEGACPTCHGMGQSLTILPSLYDLNKTLSEGAVKVWSSKPYIDYQLVSLDALCHHLSLPTIKDKKLTDFSEQEWQLLKFGIHWPGFTQTEKKHLPKKVAEGKFEGVETAIWRKIAENKEVPKHFAAFVQEATCPECNGEKINSLSRSVTVCDTRLPLLENVDLAELLNWIDHIDHSYPENALIQVQNYLLDIQTKIRRISQVGLDYLSLARPYHTLSGGEAQRIKLAALLDSKMTELIIILDEPTIGLHPDDTKGIIEMIHQIKARKNTVIVIEHDLDVIKAADQIIEIGPRSGNEGGEVLRIEGFDSLSHIKESLTYQALKLETEAVSKYRPTNKRGVKVTHANVNNLKNITVDFPKGALSVVTGVSGSGKSSLVFQTISPNNKKETQVDWKSAFSEVLTIHQKRPTRNKRSVVVTYLELFDKIRQLYAHKAKEMALSYSSADFSFNSGNGRCPNCLGLGMIESNQLFFANQVITCPECQGKRYRDELLDVVIDGLTINDLLSLTIDEALPFFAEHNLPTYPLTLLKKTNLGYLCLGQTTDTLSGGEMQRLSLARVISKQKTADTLFILDEPTTGMHPIDVHHFMTMIHSMIDAGNTFIFIEHNLAVIKQADYLVELGPGGGKNGGQLIFVGSAHAYRQTQTRTSKYLQS